MKKFDLLTPVVNGLLSFLIALSGIGCLCTAFSLDANAELILLSCAFWAVATILALQFRHGWIALPVLLVLWGLLLWKQEFVPDMLSLIKELYRFYNNAYGWGMPDFLQAVDRRDVTIALMAICGFCAMFAALSLQARRAAGALLAICFPIVPCLIVTDTPPAAEWLFVCLLCVVLVVLPQSVRRVDGCRAAKLTGLFLIPAVLLCGVLFHQYPQSEYHSNSDEKTFHDRLLDMIDRLPLLQVDEDGQISMDFSDIPQLPVPTIVINPNTPSIPIVPTLTIDPGIVDVFRDQVSLENAGPRNPLDIPVMTINTRLRSNTLYLRGQGYDIYTGTSWKISDIPQELYVSHAYLDALTHITITTNWVQGRRYLPCYPYQDTFSLENGHIENEDQALTYSYRISLLQDDWQAQWMQEYGVSIRNITEYLSFTTLSQETQQEAEQILASLGITRDTPILEAATLIRNYVRDCATYDLNTPAMPEESADFALWFLRESDTGYCVHFASAATVLLRAAGIPARYVEGYMTDIQAASTEVTEANAHAWAEYFVPGIGWLIMEATPGSGDSQVPPDGTEPTAPSTAPPTTQPTLPTKPTLPSLPTVPSTGTEPSMPTTPSTSTVPGTSTVPETSTAPGTSVVPSTPHTSLPSTSAPGNVPATPDTPQRPGLWATLATAFLLLTGICALVGQWQLRLWLRSLWLQRGDANRRAVALWLECRRMAKLRRQKAPFALRDLAWKAKYSQHTITDEELQEFTAYLQRSVAHLRKRPWYLQLIYRLIFAAY